MVVPPKSRLLVWLVSYAPSLRVGGDELDQAIAASSVAVTCSRGDNTAERVKFEIGSALPVVIKVFAVVTLVAACQKEVLLTNEEIVEACATSPASLPSPGQYLNTEPELAADLLERGMCLAGGGALLRGLPELLAHETGLPVQVAEDP